MDEPDWTKSGKAAGTIHVVYPSGTSFNVPVSVNVLAPPSAVADLYARQGQPLAPETVVKGAPEGSAITWKTEPDWSEPGAQEGTVHVTAPEGITFDVPVTVRVEAAPTPVAGLATTQGEPLPATDAVTGLPEGVTVTWASAPDWDAVGEQMGSVHGTYPSGVEFDVDATVTVTAKPEPTTEPKPEPSTETAGPSAVPSETAQPTPVASLARTGAATGGLVALASALVGAGALLVRRRRA